MSTWLDQKDPAKIDAALAQMRERSPGYADEVAGGDERFALWLAIVDGRMARSVGVTHRDIADWTWRDAYDSGMSPSEAAVEALQADDTYSALFG